jgi:hypothetical protein
VADESKEQPAVDFIMGHEVPHMSAVYREHLGRMTAGRAGACPQVAVSIRCEHQERRISPTGTLCATLHGDGTTSSTVAPFGDTCPAGPVNGVKHVF